MKLSIIHSAVVTVLLWLQLIQTTVAVGRFPFLQSVPRSFPAESIPDRLFRLPTSPRHTKFLPRKKNLKTRKLLKRLGRAFNPDWMSIEQPKHLHEVVSDKINVKLVSEARHVNFSMTGSSDEGRNVSGAMLAAFQDWLVQRGSCPVHFVWEDVGVYFWPRWVKRGFCVAEKSCSWPPGMHCLPAENRRIRLLRWQCQTRGRRTRKGDNHGQEEEGEEEEEEEEETNDTENWSKVTHKQRRKKYGMKCKWLKVPYPVTDECYCSC